MNSENMNEQSHSDVSKQVQELFTNCLEGQHMLLKGVLETYCFSSLTLDSATRSCIRKAKWQRKLFQDSINVLLIYLDINYKNPSYDNTTLFMFTCAEGSYFIIEQIINFDFSFNTFDAEQKINLNLLDINGRNFLHHLLTSHILEDEAFDIISRIVCETDFKTRSFTQEAAEGFNPNFNNLQMKKFNFEMNVKQCFNTPDIEGRTPMTIILCRGWYRLSKYIIMIAEERYLNTFDNFNYIHYAVVGKSLNCLNLVLKESNLDDVRQKNKDGFTPAELAKKIDMFYFSRIIDNFEEHCHNSNYLNIFSDKSLLHPEKIFDKFISDDYYESKFLLEQLNTIQSIRENPKKSLEFNITLSKYFYNLEKEFNNKNRKDSFRIHPENILSKFSDIPKNKNSFKKNEQKDFVKIFSNFFSVINSKNYPANCSTINQTYDIIILNKALFYYKIGDDFSLINIFMDYFKNYLDYNDHKYFKWTVYVNITFIFIETLIKNKFTKLVNLTIKKLEEFLFTKYSEKKDCYFDESISQIEGYLNSKEILHNFTSISTWDESFCILNLYKTMYNISENKIQQAKICIKEYKKLYDNCSYKDEIPIFDTLRNFYISLKINLFYYEDNINKCFKNLNKIHSFLQIENISLMINEVKINRNYKLDPYILFHFNTMGILYLKQKKYLSAEIFFKICIEHFKKTYAKIERSEFDFSIKLSEIYTIKYNLALCYFYQKKFEKASEIFKEIISNKFMNDYIFIWYRLGLCFLEIELNKLKKLRETNTVSKYISKNYGYECNFNFENYNLEKIKEANKNYSNYNHNHLNMKCNINGNNNIINNNISNNYNNYTKKKTNNNNNINKIETFNSNSNEKSNKFNMSIFNSTTSSINSKGNKGNIDLNSNSPIKNFVECDKDREEWDTIKYLNENLKDTLGMKNIDDNVENIIDHYNSIKENLEYYKKMKLNKRRIILQNNIFDIKKNDRYKKTITQIKEENINTNTNININNNNNNINLNININNYNSNISNLEETNYNYNNNNENENDNNNYSFYDDIEKFNPININKILNLNECIYCFKKVLTKLRENKLCKHNNNTSNNTNNNNINNINIEELKDLLVKDKDKEKERNEKRKTSAENNSNNNNNNKNSENNYYTNEDKRKCSKKTFNNLLTHTYLNIIYVLILNKNWIEALGYINTFKKMDFIKKENDTKIKLNNYLVEIYLNMNQFEKAKEIFKAEINNSAYNQTHNQGQIQIEENFNLDFYSSFNNNIYRNVPYRMMLHSNLIKMHFMNNNISEAEIALNNLFNSFNISSIHDLPEFVINHLIYLNMAKENYEIVMRLVKMRRVNLNNFNAEINESKNKKFE